MIETLTQESVLTNAQQTQAAQQTQLALTPSATATQTPKPSSTPIPATYISVYSGNFSVSKKVIAGKIIFDLWPCWSTAVDASAAEQTTPVLTLNGASVELVESSHKIPQRTDGLGWCPDGQTYFVATLAVGTYDVQWQWGSQSGYGTLTVVSP